MLHFLTVQAVQQNKAVLMHLRPFTSLPVSSGDTDWLVY